MNGPRRLERCLLVMNAVASSSLLTKETIQMRTSPFQNLYPVHRRDKVNQAISNVMSVMFLAPQNTVIV